MDFEEEIRRTRRPLTDDDMASIVSRVKKPKEVDELIFTQVLRMTMTKYHDEIRGVETDPMIKEYLKQKEIVERERLARLQLKLTESMRNDSNFPSSRDEALPKYFLISAIPQYLADWTEKIEAEVTDAFSLDRLFLEEAQVTAVVRSVVQARAFPLSEEAQNSLKKNLSELRFDTRLLPELIDLLIKAYSEEAAPKWNTLQEKIEELNSGEQKLTERDIAAILDVIDYTPYYKGDQDNIAIDRLVSEAAAAQVKTNLRRQLLKIKIKPERVPRLVALIKQRFDRALALPGKWVGNVMASSFGEAATQQTLNTFHSAGDRAARKQITGFAKIEAILKAVENPQVSNMTIFPRFRMRGDQLKSRIPTFQMTTLADLIESHRIISATDPRPRWEEIFEIVNGIGGTVHFERRYERLNLHRGNSEWAKGLREEDKRILEIKLNTKELFFRRIPMSQIAAAIEDKSSDYRVAFSSIDVGIIYIYYKFDNLVNIKGVKGDIPSFALNDEFAFALDNLIYPRLVELQITGIYGIDYVSVQQFKLVSAIEFGKSDMEVDDVANRVRLQFNPEKCILFGVDETIITEFIMTKIRVCTPYGYDVHPVFNEETYEFSFDSAGLRFYDYNKSVYLPLDFKEMQRVVAGDGKVRIYELLRRAILPAVEIRTMADQRQKSQKKMIGNPVPTGVQLPFQTPQSINNSNLVVNAVESFSESPDLIADFAERFLDRPVRVSELHPDMILLDFNAEAMADLEVHIDDLVTSISTAPAFADITVESAKGPQTAQVVIKQIQKLEDASREAGFTDLLLFVEDVLKKVQVTSDKIEQVALRWYYNAEGKNFAEVMAHPDVNPIYTRTDNIVEIYRTLGSEATRSILLDEISTNTDQKINPVHVELLADALTFRTPGDKPLSQDRYGLAKRGAEFIGRMFETTTEVLMEAGLGYVDNLQSFPSRIMLGLLGKGGALTAEDREEILRDPQVFKYDYPQVAVAPDERSASTGKTLIVDVGFISDRPKDERGGASLTRSEFLGGAAARTPVKKVVITGEDEI